MHNKIIVKDIVNALIISIEQELTRHHVTQENRDEVLSSVFAKLASVKVSSLNIPTVAPALYKERKNKSQSAEEFTVEHYSQYFECGLTRADIKKLDKSLYGMLMKGGFPENLKDAIPSAQGQGGGGYHSKGGSRPLYTFEELGERTRQQSRERMSRYRQKKIST